MLDIKHSKLIKTKEENKIKNKSEKIIIKSHNKISVSPSCKEKINDNSTIIVNETDSFNQFSEEKLLFDIYSNRLHPPPIGAFSKDLDFDSDLSINNLRPVLKNRKNVILGEGSFSIVQLYEHKRTKKLYAVKKMNSEKIQNISKNKNLINTEVNIHGRINHPNIIKLHNFCKNKNLCYLIMEYAEEGTLFDLVRSTMGLSEKYSFYYFIQTLNSIYFLHLHSIIHRDLKPENLLINSKNILKLCDFGWSVKLNDDKRTTFCGTVEYMAPEIIKKQKYDESIDIWSLGVLLYELVHSYSPFFSEDLDAKKIGKNITMNELKFKKGLSNEYKDLVNSLLIKDSTKRIKIEDIYQHPFMIKYINMIYLEINDKKTIEVNNIINDENGDEDNNAIEGYKSVNIKNKNNKKININNIDLYHRDTNALFESIPNEPIPKILPQSKLNDKIKKISTYFFAKNINKSPSSENNKFKNKKKLFKEKNQIAHIKSFSLGQNDPTFTELNENRLKIIISINNTQNKNYLRENKKSNKNKRNKHRKCLSNFIQPNYIGYPMNLGFYNKVNNGNNKNNINNKNINQTQSSYLSEINNSNHHQYQYISMINTNNTNNFSNIIINNNENNSNSRIILNNFKNKFKNLNLKKLKTNSNFKDLKYLRRINSDSHKILSQAAHKKNNINNNVITSAKKNKKVNNVKINKIKNKKLQQLNIDNNNKINKVSFINKILPKNEKLDLNSNNNKIYLYNKSENKNYCYNNNIMHNYKKNFDNVKKNLHFDISSLK